MQVPYCKIHPNPEVRQNKKIKTKNETSQDNLKHEIENNSRKSDYHEHEEQYLDDLQGQQEIPIFSPNVQLIGDRNSLDAKLVGVQTVHPEIEPKNKIESILPQENDEDPY